MRKSKEIEVKALPPRIVVPLVLVGSMLALLTGLTLGVAKNNIEARATLAAIYPTLTKMAEIEATRAHIIQQTATALPPDKVSQAQRDSTLAILPNLDSLCSATILRVGEIDHDQNPSTPAATLVQGVTIWHCVNDSDTQSLAFQLANGEIVNANIVDVTPMGETPASEDDPSEPAALFLAYLESVDYVSLSHLNMALTLSDGSGSNSGTNISYCGYNGYANQDETGDIQLPVSLRCDTSTTQGVDEDNLTIMNPAALSGGDSGGGITITGTNQVIGVISSSQNILKYGDPSSTITYYAAIPSIGPTMAEIQWELGQESMSGK